MGSIYWFAFFFILLAGGVGLAVQTLVAQAEGGGRRVARLARGLDRALGLARDGARSSSVSRFSGAGC